VNLSEPFIRRPVATSLVMAAIAFVGIAAFPFLPVASLPQIDFPTIQVTATLAGASAETMAVSVATPLGRQFSQIPGITQMTSLSTLGAAQVVIQFDLIATSMRRRKTFRRRFRLPPRRCRKT
jgi:multidrug efflux pump subunit AcrB